MAQVINTNVASLTTQRNLNKTQAGMNVALQRLSSGLRINSAKDDAAGLSISERMTSQIRGLNQAVRNANDGISLAQTAESAMSEMSNGLQRLRELAVQSANATNSSSDRNAIQKEVNNLVSELDRIAGATEFNGEKILDGTFGTATFQVGANAHQTIQVTTSNFKTTQYGDYRVEGLASAATAAAASPTSRVTGDDITVDGYLGSEVVGVSVGDSAKTVAENINAVKGDTGVTASAKTEIDMKFGGAGAYRLTLAADNSTAQTVSFSLDGTSGDSLSQAVDAINAVTSKTGVTAAINEAGDGVTLAHASGETITVGDTTTTNAGAVTLGATGGGATTATLTADGTAQKSLVEGQITLDSSKSFGATDGANAVVNAAATTTAATATLQKVSELDVTSFENATKALAIIDSAIAQVSDQRAQFGAVQSRFEATISNLQTVAENTSSARSRVMDADFAQETASLTKSQILQQAGIAMLAQANQLPQAVLSLLR
jgi:flagellin